ncbi:MAG: hypothetical protein NPIRA04_01340 [Nitrospirales bacterium]|nr:MAG: hypothetical protein NPIRA04_01340 [Nitrospirales bacterium]
MASKVQKKKTASRTTKGKKSPPAKKAVSKKTASTKAASRKSTVSKKSSTSAKQETRHPGKAASLKKKAVAKRGTKVAMKKESKTIPASTSKGRKETLRKILLAKRDAISQAIKHQLGQSLTEEQQRRLESAMDSGDQALVDLDREMGISLQEMRNKERRQIEEALVSLEEGTYGICAECGEEVSEKRLQALPFARLCVACQTNRELMEKIERAEQRS